ncbi:Annexin [Piedraia hortae CBS 480.64]|uniref:Annexin n=1 Tax=Piedraia hortae CBS 480.64 TaxID=1314780 RepID=A0A6A7C3G3_9PEZI|nr:Annexin [Piedraia hortae CBS 480.64]
MSYGYPGQGPPPGGQWFPPEGSGYYQGFQQAPNAPYPQFQQWPTGAPTQSPLPGQIYTPPSPNWEGVRTYDPEPPSVGYALDGPPPPFMAVEASELRKAMKGIGTNESVLIAILSRLGPIEMEGVKTTYKAQHKRDLVRDVHSETSGKFRECLESLLRGPLDEDCQNVYQAIKGLGTKNSTLNDILLGRKNADMNAIKHRFHQIYHKSMEYEVKSDLSLKTERLFEMIMTASRRPETTPINHQEIEADVRTIAHATEGHDTDKFVICDIFAHRSEGQLRTIAQAYQHHHGRTLQQCISANFFGHMKDALLYMLQHAEDPAKLDADMIHDAIEGIGTRDAALIRRIVAIHWNPDRLHQCKAAYYHYYHRHLADAVRSETRGDYCKTLLACIGGTVTGVSIS